MITLSDRPTLTRGQLLRAVLLVLTVLAALTVVPGCVRSDTKRAFLERESPVLAPDSTGLAAAPDSSD